MVLSLTPFCPLPVLIHSCGYSTGSTWPQFRHIPHTCLPFGQPPPPMWPLTSQNQIQHLPWGAASGAYSSPPTQRCPSPQPCLNTGSQDCLVCDPGFSLFRGRDGSNGCSLWESLIINVRGDWEGFPEKETYQLRSKGRSSWPGEQGFQRDGTV